MLTEPVPEAARSKRRSVAARLLRLWVRIPPGAWMSVCCECCVLSGRGLCDELITRPEKSYRLWCVVVCDLEKPREWGGHGPHWVAAPQKKKKSVLIERMKHRHDVMWGSVVMVDCLFYIIFHVDLCNQLWEPYAVLPVSLWYPLNMKMSCTTGLVVIVKI